MYNELKGILPKTYSKSDLDKVALGELVDFFTTNLKMDDADGDFFGQIYEFYIGAFATYIPQKGGEFFTPQSIVELMVDILQPYRGRVFDPCCGSGGMFVQCSKFVKEHQGNVDDISIYGQESNPGTWKMAKMNLAIRGLSGDLGESNGDSFTNDLHKSLRADFILATALRETSAFIQIIHKYRDSFVGNDNVPPERIAIFDEAQRAWTQTMIANFMSTKKGINDFPYSEPEFLINTLDRHNDWAVIICLVGGGQEINTGEAGLVEWFDSLRRSYPNWDVYVSAELNDTEYRRDRTLDSLYDGLNIHKENDLHLSIAMRSFRTPDLAAFVKAVLDVDRENAKQLYARIKDKYPILLTRDLDEAKNWTKRHCQGTMRYGLIASSGALRLKPKGIFVKNEVNVANWFLNDKLDVRSSYYLEDVVSEFDIQGLELDYTIVAWDGDLRFDGSQWTYNNFVGNRWQNINSLEKRLYLKNAYRVLLTRARQGMVIYIPEGDSLDETRKPEYYDKTYNYLKSIMI